ncbi:ribonucleotide reductase subunit alpha [Adlercreutzia faecimuris]|uniref:Ribonucleotide reductase subunit alpha n=1 Tax=Adlercreutzia faecimuris TaxID=2897341 RepID=A0ABS9WHE0_9ACTN|nr:ribonucleotide reductase subunit alpha [Adlercreutzia sp. JBNU-10]MCI2242180.1 ribonucleotide reductase subunit alpha [Adlercreutzia sp. JBNU-10]
MELSGGGIVEKNPDADVPSRDDGCRGGAADYLRRAVDACAAGDAVLGMHLYLAAFEEAARAAGVPCEDALDGIKRAWALACKHKERSLAEYIFEKMEPYLTPDETAACAEQLQGLALDRLEEFGLSREDLEDMTEMIAQDVLGMDARIVKVEHVIDHPLPGRPARRAPEGGADAPAADEAAEAPGEGAGGDAAAPEGEGALEMLARAAGQAGISVAPAAEPLTYASLAGYDDAIRLMRELGVGLQDDPDFQELVELLNRRHGVEGMPPADALLFRSPAREDANRFMAATLGELKLPSIRMRMEENLQGMPVLCVMAQAEDAPRLSSLRNAFEGGGVLVLEDVDLWGAPLADFSEEADSLLMMQLSRGAREALALIRSAVENPDVRILASASSTMDIDEYFQELLEGAVVVDIDYPTPEERVAIWMDIARDHPSLRGVNRADLVRLSANMPRFDIYMAAREAVEEAYKAGLMMRRYHPVTRDNLFDKLAAYQPLDSAEYHELEEAVVSDFRRDMAELDSFVESLSEER